MKKEVKVNCRHFLAFDSLRHNASQSALTPPIFCVIKEFIESTEKLVIPALEIHLHYFCN